VYFVTN